MLGFVAQKRKENDGCGEGERVKRGGGERQNYTKHGSDGDGEGRDDGQVGSVGSVGTDTDSDQWPV